MNKILIVAASLLIVGGGYYWVTKNNAPTTSSTATTTLTSPTRVAEINGYILSVMGNELTIANEQGVKEITAEERARRQKLSQEERQALKAQESANLTKENITVTIPVGVTIVKGSGDASGSNITASMSEIVKGGYISIWQNGESVEFVKLKGVSAQ